MRRSRALFALLTLPLVILLSGCVRFIAEYEIISPDEVKVSVDFGMQNQALEEMGTGTDDMCSDAQFADEPGAVVEPYTEDGPEGYAGCRVRLTTTAAELSSDEARIELVDGVWHFSQSGETEDTEGMSSQDATMMFSDFRVSVTFPGKVLTHSGSSTVSGRTVTWTDPADLMTVDGLQATAEDGSGGLGALPFIIGGVLALVVIGAIVAIVLTRKKKTPAAPAAPYAGAPGQPDQWGQQQPGQQWDQQAGQQWGQQPPQQPAQWGQQQPGQQWGQQPGQDQWGQQPGQDPWGQQPGQDPWGQQPPQQPGQWGQQPGRPGQGYPPQQ